MAKSSKPFPRDAIKIFEEITQLCEAYADEADGEGESHEARDELLDFCHTWAYKLNGVEPWD